MSIYCTVCMLRSLLYWFHRRLPPPFFLLPFLPLLSHTVHRWCPMLSQRNIYLFTLIYLRYTYLWFATPNPNKLLPRGLWLDIKWIRCWDSDRAQPQLQMSRQTHGRTETPGQIDRRQSDDSHAYVTVHAGSRQTTVRQADSRQNALR